MLELSLPHSPLHSRKGVFSWGCSKPSALLPPPPQTPCLLTAGRAPSTRPTSLHRYFLRKTYHLRLDRSADYAEAAAAPAHNPPQASTSLSLPFLTLFFSLWFSVSLFHSVFLSVSVFPPLFPSFLSRTAWEQKLVTTKLQKIITNTNTFSLHNMKICLTEEKKSMRNIY